MRHSITHYERVSKELNMYFGFDYIDLIASLNPLCKMKRKDLEIIILNAIGVDLYNEYKKEGLWNLLLEITHAILPFYMDGKKVFKFEKGITEMILRTELENINASFIKLPFDSIYIIVPYGLFSYVNTEGENYCVEGIYINQGITELNNPQRTLSLTLVVHLMTVDNYNDVRGDLDYVGFTFKENENIVSQVNSFFDTDESCKRNKKHLQKIISFVFNSILYLNSDKAIINLFESQIVESKKSKSSKYRRNAKEINQKLSKIPHYHVGNSIILDPKLRKEIDNENSYNSKSTLQYKSQWIVRGHWRHQACGDNYEQRKLIWIKPYIKGNSHLPICNKNYIVK